MSQKSAPSFEIKQDLLTMFDAVSDISNSVASYASGLNRQLLTLIADFHLTIADADKKLHNEVTEKGITEYNLMALNIRVDIA